MKAINKKQLKLGNDLLTFIYAVTLALGLLLAALLIFAPRKDKSSFFAGLFLFFYSLELVNHLTYHSGVTAKSSTLILLPLNFYLLHFVLFWFYALNLSGRWNFTKYKWHLIPGIIEFLTFTVLFFFSGETKLSWFRTGVILPYIKVYLLLHVISTVIYGVATLKLFNRHKKLVTDYFSNLKYRTLNWIRIGVWSSIIMAVLNNTSIIFRNYQPHLELTDILTIANLLYIILVGIFGFIQFQVFTTAQTIQLEKSIPEIEHEKERTIKDYGRLIEFIEKEKPYLQKDLVLSQLANSLAFSDRYLRLLIKTHTAMHFNNFINKFRVEETKKLLLTEEFQHYTLLAIGQEAGFKAKSTFFTAFKFFEKMTPAAFKAKIQGTNTQLSGSEVRK